MKSRLKKPLLISLVVLQAFFYPMTTFADGTDTSTAPSSSDQSQSTASSTPSTQGPQTTTGPSKPSGPDSSTYTYNKDTGLWENDLYTWNPTTHQTAPKTPQTYSYNPTSGTWDTTDYHYDPASGRYMPQTVQTTQPPVSNTTTDNGATPLATATASTPGATALAAPGTASSNTGAFDLFNGSLMSNGVFANAYTGGATVSGNTNGGNATTGNAMSAATILNLLQSTYGLLGGTVDTFSVDLTQPHFGDLTLDPGNLPSGQTLSVSQAQPSNALAVNVSNDTAMNNNVTVAANSGNAAVSGNTNGGNATSGDATALVNLLNLINSAISAGHSFIGTLNIDSNLNGDILLPKSLQEHLLASNASANTGTTNTDINSTNNTGVTNNLNLNANSGAATVNQNTNGGNATTGTGKTSLTLLNLTGQQVIAKNSLLVFVNVLGNWVGAIMNAPGATAAALGDDSAAVSSAPSNLSLHSNTNNSITNNIDASAASGNTSVDHNTSGGNATSGNANVGVNIANLTNSSFNLADWFGVLFINVLGSWNGSFGVDTAAGNTPAPQAPQTGSTNGTTQDSSPFAVAFQQLSSSTAGSSQAAAGTTDDSTTIPPAAPTAAHNGVLGAATSNTAVTTAHKINSTAMLFGISILVGLILLGIDRLLSMRKSQAAA